MTVMERLPYSRQKISVDNIYHHAEYVKYQSALPKLLMIILKVKPDVLVSLLF